jgi:RNA polymerase sigma-70 factor (ECF subfamily)
MAERIEQLWLEYHTGLLNFIKSRVINESVAEDILQEVFIRTQTRIDTLRDENKIASWLYQITRNAIVDHFRAHKSMEVLPETLKTPVEDPTEKARREIEGCLEPMIENLPPKYRQAIILSELEGLPQKEVASIQGLSLSGAKSRIQRGRAMLKDMLLDCCHFEYDNRGKVVDCQGKGDACNQC